MKFNNILLPGLVVLASITGCQKKVNNDPDTIHPNLDLTLKDAASFPLGVGVDYTAFAAGGNYTSIVKSQFDVATPGYVMKHGAIVQANGSYNFTNADAFVNGITGAGMS